MDSIASVIVTVEVQENGIIRNMAGRLIGRLIDDVPFDSDHIKTAATEHEALQRKADALADTVDEMKIGYPRFTHYPSEYRRVLDALVDATKPSDV